MFKVFVFLNIFFIFSLKPLFLFAENLPSSLPQNITSLQIKITYPGLKSSDIDDPGLKSHVRHLLGLNSGEEFNQSGMEQGIERLRLLNLFTAIETKPEFKEDGVHLVLTLEKQPIIANIKISGNYPLFKNEVRKVIRTRIGDPPDTELLHQNAEDIRQLYQGEGYYQTQVKVELYEEKQDITVKYNIEKGARTIIQKVEFEEDGKILEDLPVFKRFLEIQPGIILRENKLKKNIKELENKLVYQGFLEAGIQYKITRLLNNRAMLRIIVQKGKKTVVKFEGNKHITDKQVENKISLFENRSYAEFDLQESLEDIKEIYFEQGFLFVDISYGKKLLDQDVTQVTFFIKEGQRAFLDKITFKGNRSQSTEKLRGQMLLLQGLIPFGHNVFNKLTYEEDLKALKSLYTFEGYPWAEINEELTTFRGNKKFVSKVITINEGMRVVLNKVTFQGNRIFHDHQLMKEMSLKPGSPFTEKKWQTDRKKLVIFYSNHGYVFASVTTGAHFDKDKGAVELIYTIEEGQEAIFGKCIIRKNVKTGYSAIQDCLSFAEGELFSYQKIIESTDKINDLGLFRIVRIKPINLEKKEKKVDILVEVEEMNTGRVNFGIGYNSVKGYRGYLELRENNLAGSAVAGTLSLEYAGIGQNYDLSDEARSFQKVSLDLTDPLLAPKYKIDGNLNIFNILEEKEGYDIYQTGLKMSLGKSFHETTRLSLTYRLEAAQLHNLAIDKSEIVKNPTISSIKPMVSFDTRDNILDPRTGVFTQLGVEFAGDYIGGESNFSKLTATVSKFFSLSKKSVLALGINGGYTWLPVDEVLPLQERFYAGGINSIRGYPEDYVGPEDKENGLPIGGKIALVNNIELRHNLYRQLKGVLFFDAGNVWDKNDEVSLASLRTSAGLGLRLITPVVPIRVDYGWVLDKEPGEPAGKFYFSLGQVF